MRVIHIFRSNGYYGKFRTLKLYVDGEWIGNIRDGESKQFEIADDAQILTGKMDWAKTHDFHLQDVSDGQKVEIKTDFTVNLFRWLGLMSLPFEFEISSR